MSDPNKTRKFMETLTESLGCSDGQSPEEVKSDLHDMGIDVDAATKRMMASMEASYQKAKEKYGVKEERP